MLPPGLCLVVIGAVSGTSPENLTIDLQGKLETVVGTNISLGTPVGSVSALLSFTPGVVVEDRSQTGDLKLTYTPLLYLSVPSGLGYPSKVLVLNRVNYEATNQLSRTVGISLNGSLWYGDQNYSPVVNLGVAPGSGIGQPSGTPIAPGALPAVQLIKVLQSFTQLGFSLATSSTVGLEFDAGFLYYEGADAASRLQLPLQRGPFALARSDVRVSERDTLTPAVRLGFLRYGPIFRPAGSGNEDGSTVVVTHFQEGLGLLDTEFTLKWGHQESRALQTELATGVAFFSFSDSYDVTTGQTGDLVWIGRPSIPVPASTSVYPIVTGTVRYRLSSEEGPFDFSLSAGLAPFVNQFLATVSERVTGTLTAGWAPSQSLRFEASGGVADSFNPQELDIRGELRTVWNPAPPVAIAVGARAAWVNYAIPGAINGFNWSVFLSVTGDTGALF